MKKMPKVAVILLNYNSLGDLKISVPQVNNQKGVELITIVVDNASNSTMIEKMKNWSRTSFPQAYSLTESDLYKKINNTTIQKNNVQNFFIYSSENRGYSAGNNIGIKLADYLDVDAVLIANPDMRFENENYIYELAKVLFSKNEYFVAASKIIGLDGLDQSPLRESTFWEEFLWIKQLFPKIFKSKSYILDYDKEKLIEVPKVMGCSLMLKMSFLRQIDYFDENVFLYSEEAILAAQVQRLDGKIIFLPYIEAIHAHVKSQKGNASKRMLSFIKSRQYYLKNYSKYNRVQKILLKVSYFLLYSLHYVKLKVMKS